MPGDPDESIRTPTVRPGIAFLAWLVVGWILVPLIYILGLVATFRIADRFWPGSTARDAIWSTRIPETLIAWSAVCAVAFVLITRRARGAEVRMVDRDTKRRFRETLRSIRGSTRG